MPLLLKVLIGWAILKAFQKPAQATMQSVPDGVGGNGQPGPAGTGTNTPTQSTYANVPQQFFGNIVGELQMDAATADDAVGSTATAEALRKKKAEAQDALRNAGATLDNQTAAMIGRIRI